MVYDNVSATSMNRSLFSVHTSTQFSSATLNATLISARERHTETKKTTIY